MLRARVTRYLGFHAFESPKKTHASDDPWDLGRARECRGIEDWECGRVGSTEEFKVRRVKEARTQAIRRSR